MDPRGEVRVGMPVHTSQSTGYTKPWHRKDLSSMLQDRSIPLLTWFLAASHMIVSPLQGPLRAVPRGGTGTMEILAVFLTNLLASLEKKTSEKRKILEFEVWLHRTYLDT